MTYTKQNSRGKGGASRWNAAHKLLSKAERDKRRLEKGHVLRKLQDQIRAASDKEEAEEQLNGIRKAVELAFGFTAKLEQVGLLWSLVFDREDRILVAKTGYGKSVVPQLLPLLTRSSIVIVLLPLNAEQLADIQRLPLAKPIWLSSKNNNTATLRRIRAGIFTHVLVSPEIACSLRFYENVLSDAGFRRQTKAIVIDEVHLVVD
jgi:hypothetical protein